MTEPTTSTDLGISTAGTSTESTSTSSKQETAGPSAISGISEIPTDDRGPHARQTVRWKIKFDSIKMLFDTTYPENFRPVLPEEEWEGIIRHLNTDLNQSIQSSMADLHAWTTGMLISCAAVVGVVIIPVVWVKTSRHQRAMEVFWKHVKEFFTEINRKTFIRRGLEWKVVEDKRTMRKRDCYNPVYLYRAELVWRKGVTKSKRELARERGIASYGSISKTGTSASEVAVASAPAAIAQETKPKRKSALRPPSTIESVKEVSPEREHGVEPIVVAAVPASEPIIGDEPEAKEPEEETKETEPEAKEPEVEIGVPRTEAKEPEAEVKETEPEAKEPEIPEPAEQASVVTEKSRRVSKEGQSAGLFLSDSE
jgi:hypothetical protein